MCQLACLLAVRQVGTLPPRQSSSQKIDAAVGSELDMILLRSPSADSWGMEEPPRVFIHRIVDLGTTSEKHVHSRDSCLP